MKRLAALLVLSLAAAPAQAAEKPARPRLCPEDAPEGVRLPPQPGCGTANRAERRPAGTRALGDGIDIRIGGRVGAEFGARR